MGIFIHNNNTLTKPNIVLCILNFFISIMPNAATAKLSSGVTFNKILQSRCGTLLPARVTTKKKKKKLKEKLSNGNVTEKILFI